MIEGRTDAERGGPGRGCRDTTVLVAAAYTAHQGELVRFACRSVRDPDQAVDIVHEAYLRLMLVSSEGRMPANARAWLYAVSRNLIVSRARSSARSVPIDAEFEAPGWVGSSPEEVVLDAERDRDLRSLLDELPDRERRSLVLAATGYSCREIARVVGIREGATRTMMSRARARARGRLAGPS